MLRSCSMKASRAACVTSPVHSPGWASRSRVRARRMDPRWASSERLSLAHLVMTTPKGESSTGTIPDGGPGTPVCNDVPARATVTAAMAAAAPC